MLAWVLGCILLVVLAFYELCVCDTLIIECYNIILNYCTLILKYSCLILQIVKSHEADASIDRLSAIDYFGTVQTNRGQSSSKVLDDDDVDDKEEYEVESADSALRVKRKQKHVETDVRTKKKKTKSNKVDMEGKIVAHHKLWFSVGYIFKREGLSVCYSIIIH